MGMSAAYGERDDAESLATLDRALELGVGFWDTADVYGPFTNEELLAKALKGRRGRVFLATKFGIVRDPSNPTGRGVNGRPEYVRESPDDFAADDFRRTSPRFQGENFARNLLLVE